MDTYFAPAPRTERRQLRNQIEAISRSPVMNTLLNAASGLLVVLNEERQIVALNHSFLDKLGIQDPETALGLRLGETLSCVHAAEPPNGCGTTPFCKTCGAAIAMMTTINDDQAATEVCALTAEIDGTRQDLCLVVQTESLLVDGNRWILVYVQDVTREHFLANLERVFFHDLNNVLTSLLGNCELLALELPNHELLHRIKNAAVRMGSEISLQRCLSHHKDAKYLLQQHTTALSEIRREVTLLVAGNAAAKNKELHEEWPAAEIEIQTDPLLLSRVLGNMLLNALEATPEGGLVRLTTRLEPTMVVWEVWNGGHIPNANQGRIFQRHFSTKSQLGHGLGTYAMKLFGERYLGGSIFFHSTPAAGTLFTFRLPRRLAPGL